MGLQDIIDAAERVGDSDEERQEAFRREFDADDAADSDTFEATREALAKEREALETLDEQLAYEAANIEELIANTEFLSVDQAVRHREATIEKLRRHNDHLREFHDAMTAALDAVEENLDALERAGPEAVDADPEPAFERAREALEAHNDAVAGLDRNMMILDAYLR
jgi:DNA repair exonuclease SbcCD ATPase subunit